MAGCRVVFAIFIGFIGVGTAEIENPLLPRQMVTNTGRMVEVSYFTAVLNPTPTVQGLFLTPNEYKVRTGWSKTTLTYCVRNYPSRGTLTNQQVESILAQALKRWSDVSCLQFQKNCAALADIEISFETGSHGDGAPFDGTGRTLAHAFFPTSDAIGGDAHFDDAETFTTGSDAAIDLMQVATHEFGHSLGIDHSEDRSAVMYPTYSSYNPNFQLGQDDINAIQYLYGACTSQSTTTTTTTTTTTRAPTTTTRSTTTTQPSWRNDPYDPYYGYQPGGGYYPYWDPYWFYRYRYPSYRYF